jgi:hypothetical protein
VIAVLLAVIVIFRDSIVETAVIRGGSAVVGTPVNIESFNTSLAGSVEIKGLTVGNPEGYHKPHIFSLDRVHVKIDPLSLLSDKIIIEEIIVSGLHIDFESKLTTNNLSDIRDNIEVNLGITDDGDTAAAAGKAPEQKEAAAQKELVIRHLSVSDYSVSVSSKMLYSSLVLILPPVDMENIGEGKPISETIDSLYMIIIESITKAVSASGKIVGDAAGVVGDAAGVFGNAVNDIANGTASAAGDAVNAFGKQLKNVFKK